MNALPHWTKRATQRLRDAVRYIAVNFYPAYTVAFNNDVHDGVFLRIRPSGEIDDAVKLAAYASSGSR